MAEAATVVTPYQGSIELGMVFDFEPGKKHAYERMTITRREGKHIWAFGRSGETYHDEADFRQVVVFVADKPIIKKKLSRCSHSLAAGGRADRCSAWCSISETGKKARRRVGMIVIKREGEHIWARGRGGESYHVENNFRDVVAFVPAGATVVNSSLRARTKQSRSHGRCSGLACLIPRVCGGTPAMTKNSVRSARRPAASSPAHLRGELISATRCAIACHAAMPVIVPAAMCQHRHVVHRVDDRRLQRCRSSAADKASA